MSKAITAKVMCGNKTVYSADGSGQAQFTFYPDYAASRNKEWASSTPTLNFQITVKNSDLFEVGKSYTVTFEEDPS